MRPLSASLCSLSGILALVTAGLWVYGWSRWDDITLRRVGPGPVYVDESWAVASARGQFLIDRNKYTVIRPRMSLRDEIVARAGRGWQIHHDGFPQNHLRFRWPTLGFDVRQHPRATPTIIGGSVLVTVPCWLPLALFAAPPLVTLRRRLRGRRWRRAGRCAACGYDVRASAGRCPECGAAISADPTCPAGAAALQSPPCSSTKPTST